MSKIMITGATGPLGNSVIHELIKKQGVENISALVRDLSKAPDLIDTGVHLVQGDYDDYTTLVTAFRGVDKLYFVSGSDVVNRIAQHERIVKAATDASVGHIIYTSVQRKTDELTSPIAFVASAHILTEQLILESGLPYTILKHALYAEVLPQFMGDQVIDSGVIYLPAGEGKVSFTSRTDMARAGVTILTGEGHENKTYEISVDASYSFYDIADLLTGLAGKPINYAEPDVGTFSSVMAKAGVPEEAIQGMADFCTAIAHGEFDFPDSTLEKLIGQKPESLRDFLKKAYKL